jgi:hypothetical protein
MALTDFTLLGTARARKAPIVAVMLKLVPGVADGCGSRRRDSQ